MMRNMQFQIAFALLIGPFARPVWVRGDWIDPDTPESAYETQPLGTNVDPYPPEHHKKKVKNTTHHKIQTEPSMAPSWMPSEMPSGSPSVTPTMVARTYELVFSDEFNTPGRTFEDGTDPRWTALNKNDYTNDALHYYSEKNIKTNDAGELVITSEAADTDVVGFDDVNRKRSHQVKHFRSGMLQSWNKACFTGGIFEAEVTLPGNSSVGGLWPAFWLLGNLARHTYVGSSQHIWPWSDSNCTSKSKWAQAINGCSNVLHYGFESGQGRGAPEIDIFEVQPGDIKANQENFLQSPVGQPFLSASFQVAPGRPNNRPGPGYWPGPDQWYHGLKGGRNTSLNILFYGNYNHFRGDPHPQQSDYWSDAISFNRQLDEDYFERPHKYRLEWEPPTNSSEGYLHWFLDGELVLAIDGNGVEEAGQGAQISSEPMYILLNTAISKQWGFPSTCPTSCPCKKYDCQSSDWDDTCGFSDGFCEMMTSQDDPEYKINYVRVYQDPNNDIHKVGCSTPERPTRRYIEAHAKDYKTKEQEYPLKGIQRGRGSCTFNYQGNETKPKCGGPERGFCTRGRVCECLEGWTGPHCLVHQGYDPISYDVAPSIKDVGFVWPSVAPFALLIGLGALSAYLLVTLGFRRRLDGWTPIPDVK